MRLARAVCVLSSGVAAVGCPAPAYEGVMDEPLTSGAPAESPSTGEAPTSAGASEGVVTTTESPTGGPPEETSAGAATSGDAPTLPPVIEAVELAPPVLEWPGAIEVTVTTKSAAGVRMAFGGAQVELVPAGPDQFTSQLPFHSHLANGAYKAQFVPWSGGREGAAETRMFAVDLPDGGTEIFWEAIGELGKGEVAGLAVLPDGEVVEFGTLVGPPSRCYLRRRHSDGGWTLSEDVVLLPEAPCAAIDVGVDADDGSLYLLADRSGDGVLSWWLARMEGFGGPTTNVRFGAPKETARALALQPGRAAVCGTQPTGKFDVDAAVWIFPFGKEGSTRAFDYLPPGWIEKHQIVETAQDCALVGDRLVLVGSAFGKHDPVNVNAPQLERLFVLEYGLGPQTEQWTVDGDPKDLVTQSRGHALAVDDEGRYVVAGSTCGAPCGAPTADLRRYAPGGALEWSLELASQLTPARALAWHPGGYVVLAGAAETGPWTSAFFVQAWQPEAYPALWSFDKNVLPTLHMATAVVIGPFGQVYTGGVGSDGYPAVAFIYG